MFLADKNILSVLDQFNFVTDSDDRQFNAAEQVQPCSIDLTLSNVFWIARGRRTVDLRRSQLQEVSPRHNWKRVIVKAGQSLIIKPGTVVLGRTCEKFTMPAGYAGNLEGRSSFARLGLMVHCTGSFINPGWRGHMPLQLVNLSRSPIRLVPHIPVCQLQVIPLTQKPDHVYGERELQSKYMDDDGGPSYWWRDKRITQLQNRLGQINVGVGVEQQVLELIGPQESEVVARFQKDIDRMHFADLQHTDAALDEFASREDRRSRWATVWRTILIGQLSIFLLGGITNSIFSRPIGLWHWLFWLATPISATVAYLAFAHPVGDFFGTEELRVARASKTREPTVNR